MLFCGVFGFQRRNRLAAPLYTPGDAWRLTQFSGIWLELLGGDDQPSGDANLFLFFSVFSGAWADFCSEGKLTIFLNNGLDILMMV